MKFKCKTITKFIDNKYKSVNKGTEFIIIDIVKDNRFNSGIRAIVEDSQGYDLSRYNSPIQGIDLGLLVDLRKCKLNEI